MFVYSREWGALNLFSSHQRTEDEVTEEEEYQVYRRALRSVPGAGVIWSRYLRFLVCAGASWYMLTGIF